MSESPASELWRGVAHEHARTKHDHAWKERDARSVADEIAHHRHIITFLRSELARPDWQLLPHPERTRERYAKSIAAHEQIIALEEGSRGEA